MTAPLDRIDHLFAHNARTLPDSAHLVLPDGTAQTYGQTFERARRIAQALVAAGVRRGDRVLLFLGNSRELEELYIATSLAGAICVPVNTLTTARELVGTAADCAPRALVVQQQFLDRVTPELRGADVTLRLVVQGEAPGWTSYDAALAGALPVGAQVSADPDDPCVMIYSSGTTGKPKGILLRQRAVIDNALMVVRVMRYQMSDVFLTMLPLFSSFGFAWDFLMPAHVGARTVLLARFDPAEAAARIEEHRVTVLTGVPTMFARLFDATNVRGRDLASLRLLDVGGGPVSDRLKHDLKHQHGIEIVESYGLSEISPTASVQIPFGRHKPGSCGPALPGIEVKVVDANGAEAAPGTPGELCFRSPTFMIGYWGKPDLTAQSLRDGWLHSGDIGTVDEDGHIYIRDRLKDLIITSGYNVYPKEVENALCEHPAVQTCAAVGLPDEIRGENIHAFVVLKSGAAATEAALIEHCGRLIAKYKVPRGVTLVDELPLTASGKIQRFQLRERVRRAQGRTS